MADRPMTPQTVAKKPCANGETPVHDESDFDQGRRMKWGAVIFFVIFVVAEAPYVLESFIATHTAAPPSASLGSSSPAPRGMP